METTIKDIDSIQNEITEEFSALEDPMDRYEYIIDLGKDLLPMSDQFKTEQNIVKGCQSTVWMRSFTKDGRIFFQADSDTLIIKGIIALLIRILSNQKPEDIIHAELFFIDKIKLRAHLSPQRSNGLNAIISQVKEYAIDLSKEG
ncbi:MAG: SufE family protein [Chitinophagaceae bacterium]|nr:MAG: SufE family protein [Chitinophagaceae bacterium]